MDLMKRRSRAFLFFASLTVSAIPFAGSGLTAQSADDAALRQFADKYYAAYSHKDLPAIARLWSARAPELAANLQKLSDQFVAEDRLVSNITVTDIKLRDNRAVIMVTGDVEIVKKASGQRTREPFARNLALARERDEWKVWREAEGWVDLSGFLVNHDDWKNVGEGTPLVDRFAAALADAGNASERNRLIAENSEMLTPELVRKLMRLAEVRRADLFGSQETLNTAKTIAERIGDKEGTALAYLGLAETRKRAADARQALSFYNEASAIFEAIGDQPRAATTLVAVAGLYRSTGVVAKAIENYEKALKLYESLSDSPGAADVLAELGSIYSDRKEYVVALRYYERCLKLRETAGDRGVISTTLRSIGNVHYFDGNFEAAVENYVKARSILEAAGDRASLAVTLNS
ncbi:MAG TPA: tetratricopeptide repeat protein, partial [Blastocatellia bacterium]|nr:tetratricopeptide repeat protein [Blastocatellia bacterium]